MSLDFYSVTVSYSFSLSLSPLLSLSLFLLIFRLDSAFGMVLCTHFIPICLVSSGNDCVFNNISRVYFVYKPLGLYSFTGHIYSPAFELSFCCINGRAQVFYNFAALKGFIIHIQILVTLKKLYQEKSNTGIFIFLRICRTFFRKFFLQDISV